MKRTACPEIEKLGVNIIYKEEIDSILEICKQECEKVEISVDEFELDSSEEIYSLNRSRLSRLRITTQNPQLIIDLGPNDSTVWIEDLHNITLVGLRDGIKQITLNNFRFTRHLSWIATSFATQIQSFLFFGSLVFMVLTRYSAIRFGGDKIDKINQLNLPEIAFTIGLVFLILNFIFLYIESKQHSIIYTLPSSKFQSFFARNKDSIILAILSSLLTLAVTLLSQWLAGDDNSNSNAIEETSITNPAAS